MSSRPWRRGWRFSDRNQGNKRIGDAYTFVVPRFGRIILNADRKAFDTEIELFRSNLEAYHQAVLSVLESIKVDFKEKLTDEYLPRWQENPPASFARYGLAPSRENLEKQLRTVV